MLRCKGHRLDLFQFNEFLPTIIFAWDIERILVSDTINGVIERVW